MSRQRSATLQVEYHKSLIAANEYAMVIRSRLWPADVSAPAAIYCPAYGAGAFNMMGWFVAHALAMRGFSVVASDLGDTPSTPFGTNGPGVWGNDASQTKLAAVYDFTQNVLKAQTKVAVMGASHGAAAAARWVSNNNAKAICLLMAIGSVDTQDILTNNRNSYRASVQAAFGLGVGVTMPGGVTGVACAPNITVPCRDYYSDDDPICVLSTHQAFEAANSLYIDAISFGSVAHSLTGFPVSEAADWVLGLVA